MRKNKKPKTLGEMTKKRTIWHMNPITRVKPSKKKYNRKREKRVED